MDRPVLERYLAGLHAEFAGRPVHRTHVGLLNQFFAAIRRHWERARKVNANGETVPLDPDGPLAEASRAKQRISRATQALPNGYCGLPLVKTCPHANACGTQSCSFALAA